MSNKELPVLASALVRYLKEAADYPFARLEKVTADEGRTIIDLTVEPELSQVRKVEILPKEPVRVVFPADSSLPPRIFSRREDFPHNQVHTYYSAGEDGLCLCLWEEPWHELRRSLTAQNLVERIRQWFFLTASGDIHQEGQALEPLLPPNPNTLIVPSGEPQENWIALQADEHEDIWTVILGAPDGNQRRLELKFEVLPVRFAPIIQGAVRKRPQDLKGLFELADEIGTNLREKFRSWLIEPTQLSNAHLKKMLVMAQIPKVAAEEAAITGWELSAFILDKSLAEVGAALGVTLFSPEAKATAQRVPAVPENGLEAIRLEHWRVMQRINQTAARTYAGYPALSDKVLVAIGAGAVGSNTIVNTVHAGIGKWTIVDDDIVLPHNTVRQFQDNRAVGFAKAYALAVDADQILDTPSAAHIRANILDPKDKAEQIANAIKAADAVVDFSASPAVLGNLSDNADVRRGVSLFFNPTGTDLVILVEDPARTIHLDELEAQYFLAVTQDDALKNHLAAARTDFIRYANACQDVSHPLPPWQVQTLCGIASGQLMRFSDQETASARVWHLNPLNAEVTAVSLSLSKVLRGEAAGWRITVSESVILSMARHRRAMEPRETGGIFIGTFDLNRKVAHVLLALPAPADSVQEPTYFVRGIEDLQVLVNGLASTSAGTLQYLGEWHSHPRGVAARPSDDDEKVFDYLEAHIGPTAAPFIMAICGTEEVWFRFAVGDAGRAEFIMEHPDG